MKLVTYVAETPFGPVDRLGALDGGRVVDLSAAYEAEQLASRGHAAAVLAPHVVPPTLIGLLRVEELGMEAARVALDHARSVGGFSSPVNSVRLLAPLPRPNSMRDFMLVEEHVRNCLRRGARGVVRDPRSTGRGTRTRSSGPRTRSAGRHTPRSSTSSSRSAAVIGRRVRGVASRRRARAIAGYTIFNDWSARDIQLREMEVGLGPGLGKDFASSIGPVPRRRRTSSTRDRARWRRA